MTITLLTVGSRGDIEPFLALGRGLRAAGYSVRLATHGRFKPYAEQYQFEFAEIHADPRAMINSPAGQAWIGSDRNPISLISNLIKLGKPVFEQLTRDAAEACRGSDLVVFSLFGNAAFHVAEQMGVPAIMAHLQPIMGRNGDFAAAGSPIWPSQVPILGPIYNQFSYRLVEQVLWQPFRPLVQRWRQSELGLPRDRFWGPYRRLEQSRQPVLYAFSRSVVARPAVWPDHYHVTGYWQNQPTVHSQLDHACVDGWMPPAKLVDFISDGPERPIYIGFGSMVDKDPNQLLGIVLDSLEESGQRAVLLSGWAELGTRRPLPPSVYAIGEEGVPHAWLFPQMQAVVHHGGAGTTAAGLRAGVPSIVVPYFADQHFWGDRVFRLGVGPRPLPRRTLRAERFSKAIKIAIRDQEIQRRAAALGSTLRSEDGVTAAVQIIAQQLALSKREATN